MGAMDSWDVTLLIVAGYLAVAALIRLMAQRRDQVLGDFRQKMAAENKRKSAESGGRKSA